MPSRRDKIKMTEDEIAAFIESQRDVHVATLGKDGMPHLSTLWFAVIDGRIVFETFTKSQKIVNLKRDPRISVILAEGDTYPTLRGVSIQGHAELVDDHEGVKPVAAAVIRKNQPEIPPDAIDAAAAQMAAKRTAVTIVPGRVMSWDHRKLDVAY